MTSEEKRDFWNIVFSNGDQISLPMSSQDNSASIQVQVPTSVSASNDNLETSNEAEEFDYSISSLGPFLDLLLEKVELMPTNNLSTNLLVTSILSQLSSFPQPLLRGVLVHPDVILQPSVRGLYTAISSLRQKLGNVIIVLQSKKALKKFVKHCVYSILTRFFYGKCQNIISREF